MCSFGDPRTKENVCIRAIEQEKLEKRHSMLTVHTNDKCDK